MISVFFPISVSITQKTAPNVKVAAISNATFVMPATNRSGGPSQAIKRKHAKEAIQAFDLRQYTTPSSLNLRLELVFCSILFGHCGNQFATTSLATSWSLTAESWLSDLTKFLTFSLRVIAIVFAQYGKAASTD
ncbi:hypothetical protein [Rhizobium leguminosarum]|uniref:hypothetical protein n=1 Tax=Rhizobium leguminosarum TaxID=384 RepID=UPI001C93AB42|nr:hypothetical protein [Rhizobium leguminosarum]MBY5701018.1 hypothetical protein [Rhizobium leguminosarum]